MEKLLTPKDLATLLNVKPGWVYDRTRAGGPELLPHYKLGKYLRFDLKEVLEYLYHRRAHPQGHSSD